jgi:hypothetical protein
MWAWLVTGVSAVQSVLVAGVKEQRVDVGLSIHVVNAAMAVTVQVSPGLTAGAEATLS